MIILAHTKTHEDCPNKCKGLSYLHDNQEEKTCGICGTKWNRIDNTIEDKLTEATNEKIELIVNIKKKSLISLYDFAYELVKNNEEKLIELKKK